jgi:D-3-phosphoglycerate dehydrogenase / 2-oxoglutarate reductase
LSHNLQNMSCKIVYSDHVFPNLDMEIEMFAEVNGEVVDGEAIDAPLEDLVKDADALVVMYHPVDAALISEMSKVKIINRSGIGFDIVDLKAATKKGIFVTNIPDYCISEVADHAMALMLAMQRKIVFYNERMKSGEWGLNEGWTMHRLDGQTLGLLAFGNIARAVCKRALAFGMKVITFDPYLTDQQITSGGAEPVHDLEELLTRLDVLSVHTPLTPETRGMIGRKQLAMMKRGSFVINVARGGIIDEAALLDALDEGHIQGAGVDVFTQEPLKPDNPLMRHPLVLSTPHAAWNSAESEIERRRKSVEDVIRVLKGEVPKYLVNREVLKVLGRE